MRIGAGMALMLLLVVALAVLALNTIGRIDQLVARQLAATIEGTNVGTGLVAAVNSEIRTAELYLQSPSDSLRDAFVAHGDDAYAYQRRYRELRTLGTDDRVILNRIAEQQARLEVAYARAFAYRDMGRDAESRTAAMAARAPAAAVVDDVRNLSNSQSAQALQQQARLQQQADTRRAILIALAVAAALIAGATGIAVLRSIRRPLDRLIGAAARFGSGDLRPFDFGGEMPTELAQVASALEHMRVQLRALAGSVAEEARKISSSASDFSAMSEELAATSGEISTAMVRVADGAERQANGMKSADSLLSELRETTLSNTNAARHVVDVGNRIRSLAEYHGKDVQAASQTLLDLKEVVRTSADQVQALTRLSRSITDFIDLIKQISSQTNLLALNAAIEAARAGEHGRGFAVVVDEVRRLADSSAKAAEEVQRTVQTIHRQVGEVASTMDAGQAKVAGVETVAESVARALQEISLAVEDVRTAADAVSREAARNEKVVVALGEKTTDAGTAASENASASEEVTAAAEEQNASTEEMATAAAELLQASQRLTSLVEAFKV